MKKTYKKPRVYVETFELLEHIASCKANQDVTTVTYRDGNTCTYTDANVTLFYNSDCKNEYFDETVMTWEEYIDSFKPENNGGCYNAFTDGNFFAS